MAYRNLYAKWKADPEGYWLDAAGAIDWIDRPKTALNASRAPLYEWFTSASVNTCWNAVDRHVAAASSRRPIDSSMLARMKLETPRLPHEIALPGSRRTNSRHARCAVSTVTSASARRISLESSADNGDVVSA